MTFRLRVFLALFFALTAVMGTVGLLSAVGATWWQADDVEVCGAANTQEDQQITTDGSGGAIVTWADKRDSSTTGDDIYAQRLDAYGNALWAAHGVSICTATSSQLKPQIAPDGSRGSIVTWYDHRSGTRYDIYAQRVDQDGNVLWQVDGVSICTATDGQWNPQLVSDGAGGAIVTWNDYRQGGGNEDIYAERVDANGNTLWHADGMTICVAASFQTNAQIVSDGSGGAIITWVDNRSASDLDVYGQRVNASGTTLWDADGVTVCAADGTQNEVQIASGGSGGAIVAWKDQ